MALTFCGKKSELEASVSYGNISSFSDHAAVYFSITRNTQINMTINNTGNVTNKELILGVLH